MAKKEETKDQYKARVRAEEKSGKRSPLGAFADKDMAKAPKAAREATNKAVYKTQEAERKAEAAKSSRKK